LLLPSFSCQDDLEETNINPNEALTAQPDYLLGNAIKTSVDTYWGLENNMNTTSLIVQHFARIQYTDPDRYIFGAADFDNAWNNFYAKVLTDLSKLAELGEKENNPTYQATALILRAWTYSLLTDLYGDIPYTQAIQIEQYLAPVYTTQQEVYQGNLADLKTALDLLNSSSASISGDFIYKGNVNQWKKFAQALRYRFALRIADRDPTTARQVIASIPVSDLFASNEDNAVFKYQSSPNQNPIALFHETRDDFRISKSIVETLRTLQDPRLPVYANPIQNSTIQVYIGVPNGLTNSEASNLGFSTTSKIGAYFTRSDAPAIIISYAEVLFNRAEAAARGFTDENAAELYTKAITASFNQFGITDQAAIDTYLSQPAVQYDASNFRKSIGEQKWIALFGQGPEAFAEWRRLDYPQLQAATAGALNGKIPVRFVYPTSEQSLNRKNYQEAVARQGQDVLTTKVWFDVQ
jgi:hypothetical protein